MDWLQVVVLSLVQGITEFLPISSSGHLILPSQLTDWPDQGLLFDVAVHFGTLLAVIAYFRGELLAMLFASKGIIIGTANLTANERDDFRLALMVIVGTLPVVTIGFTAKPLIETYLRTIPVIASTTLVFGVLLWLSDRVAQSRDDSSELTWLIVMGIGLAQCLALIPGTSRSGITITAALFFGLARTTAARFSFLLAIPTIAGAQLLMLLDLSTGTASQSMPQLAAAMLLAGGSAYCCIHFFIKLVEKTGMLPYVIYRLLLGCFLFGLYFL